MAEELGTTPNRISTWERGLGLPSAYFRTKLCSLLGADAQELGLLQTNLGSTSPLEVDSLPGGPPTVAEPPPDKSPGKMHVFSHLCRHPVLIGTLSLVLILSGGLIMTNLNGWLHPAQTNPYAPYVGQLVLNDSLRDQSSGVNWQEGTNANQANCIFKNEEYTAYQPLAGYFHACIAQTTDYKNFAYEVVMTIHSGEFAGIVFRSENGIDAHYYLFRIHIDGTYWLFRFTDHTIEHAMVLDHGFSQVFHTGFGQANLVAVVAQNDLLTLYLNSKEVTSVHDASYTHGQIGVLSGNITHVPAEATFKNAKVWAW